jgi:hypothetical protein
MFSYRSYGVVSGVVVAAAMAAGNGSALAESAAPVAGPVVLAPSVALMQAAYRAKANGDLEGAARWFRLAQSAGADPQRVALEIGYAATDRGALGEAHAHFTDAAQGPDPALAAQARGALEVLPQRWWADVYAESQGWHRSRGASLATDLVPTVRARVYLRPSLDLDLQLYVYAQATRDTASRGRDAAGVPAIYADDYALAGGGLLLRLAQRRLGLFVQAGPAFNLLDDGRPAMTLDVRAGAQLAVESSGCRPERGGRRWRLSLCGDLYGEGVYVSRFRHNLIGFGRAHLGMGYLMTGPVAWQLLLQARGGGDRNADYYNNFADGGLVHRWRLLGRLPFDLTVGVNGGRYAGRAGLDPAPTQLRYLDLRVLAATYLEF